MKPRVRHASALCMTAALVPLLALLPEEHEQGPVVLRLPVTAQEFAAAIGIAPETFSRALKRLEDDRILAREGVGRYRVLDPDGLKQAASPPID